MSAIFSPCHIRATLGFQAVNGGHGFGRCEGLIFQAMGVKIESC